MVINVFVMLNLDIVLKFMWYVFLICVIWVFLILNVWYLLNGYKNGFLFKVNWWLFLLWVIWIYEREVK